MYAMMTPRHSSHTVAQRCQLGNGAIVEDEDEIVVDAGAAK